MLSKEMIQHFQQSAFRCQVKKINKKIIETVQLLKFHPNLFAFMCLKLNLKL